MRQYLVRVHCCGSRWLVYVPAIDLWSFAITKQEIRSIATQMISSETGADSDLDLQEGRVLSVPIEFTREHPTAKRWLPAEASAR